MGGQGGVKEEKRKDELHVVKLAQKESKTPLTTLFLIPCHYVACRTLSMLFLFFLQQSSGVGGDGGFGGIRSNRRNFYRPHAMRLNINRIST